jgi:SNF2 family DNA or RNA helicase
MYAQTDLPPAGGELEPGAEARAVLAEARRLRSSTNLAFEERKSRRKDARKAYEKARKGIVERELAAMPLGRLRETTKGGLRLGALETAGFKTVGSVTRAGRAQLERIHGVGPHTASQVIAAARQLEAAMTEGLRLRFDPDRRPAVQTTLLDSFYALETAETAIGPLLDELEQLTVLLDRSLKDARRASSRLRLFFSRKSRREQARQALAELNDLVQSPATKGLDDRLGSALNKLHEPRPTGDALWDDFERRVVVYNGRLVEIGELSPGDEAVQGYVPAELAERVHKQPLDTTLLRVSLRGYQAFGAKFALAQGKAMVGDEMGLGKTIEALAAMCHLQSQGASHFLVVCPASVIVNWCHETERHTDLHAYRIHGADRDINLRAWVSRGGIAVTTFDSLYALTKPSGVQLAMLVVDEAHYVKNPRAQRTYWVRQWIDEAERTLFLTGTPLENRVDEFRTLVHHLQPAVAGEVSALDGLVGAARFRAAVAPVYLRRNQSDVLAELPPRIETEEWVDFESDDLTAYRNAVASGNFMAMRQAAYAPGTVDGSSKLSRLVEIVEEVATGDRKAVVFSYFRGVLDTVTSNLDSLAMGPLTGSVPPVQRQKLVDEFSARRGPAVLVSQIQAGGVGLNIQAASVVILTEPQWKPSTEDQAIARCHRMGQSRPVDVHRLLAENSVDERMLEILATKAVLFDEYVRKSALKELSPDSVDVSDLEATKDVVSQAEAERRIIEIERRRLGLEARDDEPGTSSASDHE